MRNLARELELGANMSVELNNADVLSDAVDAMIEKLDRRSPVLYWLLEYIEERIADDKRWNVSSEIKGFGRNISMKDTWRKVPDYEKNWPTRLLFLRIASSYKIYVKRHWRK